jgi:hypothetical protein
MRSYLSAALFASCVALQVTRIAAAGSDPGVELGLPPGAAAALRGIDAEHIRAHVRFLADDLLEGRGTGARGGDVAAKYIAAQFALDGLRPAGDKGDSCRRSSSRECTPCLRPRLLCSRRTASRLS